MDAIVLDDGIEYVIIKELEINNTTYTLFANTNDPKDICFRKTIIKDNEEFFVGLDDEKEFDLVAIKFSENILK